MDPHYVIPAILALLVVAFVIALVISLGGGGETARVATAPGKPGLAPWYTVRDGDNYTQIAQKTGLTVDQLETFNPYTDPATIAPGQRLALRMNPPLPKPKPKGPKFHTVRSGESFGSIAAKTHHSITNLQRLNPKLHVTTLQPGDRMRLWR
ncbi:MAG TPA: LysM peptidoglycan-binding domain-containing protein [Solirubrobacteraceae bacterium]|nr:LysM peptidoglycan-binding domain-containing protein [Solirubrobacteraceae bacterium]